MPDLGFQIHDYIEATSRVVTADDVLHAQVPGNTAHDSIDAVEVFDLREPVESPVPAPRKRRAAVLGVAAAILIVAGVVVVVDRNDSSVETEPVSSATTPEPGPRPTPPDNTPQDVGPPPSVVDSLGYRWSPGPDDEAAFGHEAVFDPEFGGYPTVKQAGDPWGAARHMTSVTAGGPGLVAVGTSGVNGPGCDFDAAVWTSLDGITWSPVPHDGVALGVPFRDQSMDSVTAGGPGLVAVGRDEGCSDDQRAAVWTSVDGIVWSRVPHDEAVFGGEGSRGMTSVTAGGPGLVAVGFEGTSFDAESETGFGGLEWGGDLNAAVWTSADGIVWSRVPFDEAVFGGAGRQAMTSVTAGGPGLVAVGIDGPTTDADAAVWTSADGIVWSRVPHDEAVFGGADSQAMTSVAVGGPGLVAVGADGPFAESTPDRLATERLSGVAAVWTSVDGIVWSRALHDNAAFGGDDFQTMSGVIATDPGLLAVGLAGSNPNLHAAAWTSVDGVTWSRVRHDESVFGGAFGTDMTSVAVRGPGLVAVGSTGVNACCLVDAAVWIATLEN